MGRENKQEKSRETARSKKRKREGSRGQPAIEEAGNVGHTEKKIKNPRGKV